MRKKLSDDDIQPNNRKCDRECKCYVARVPSAATVVSSDINDAATAAFTTTTEFGTIMVINGTHTNSTVYNDSIVGCDR